MGVSVCTLKFDVAIAPGYAECLVEMWEPSETTPSFDEGATPSSYSLSWDGEHSARLQTRSNNSGINEDDTQRPLLPMSTPALAPGNRLCGWPSWVPCSLALSPRPQAQSWSEERSGTMHFMLSLRDEILRCTCIPTASWLGRQPRVTL